MKQQPSNQNQIVYKCNSKHCKHTGYHAKNEGRTITLKLFIGNDCPLDFEEQVVNVIRENPVVTEVRVPANPQMPASEIPNGGKPRKPVVPVGLIRQGLQMRPPEGA